MRNASKTIGTIGWMLITTAILGVAGLGCSSESAETKLGSGDSNAEASTKKLPLDPKTPEALMFDAQGSAKISESRSVTARTRHYYSVTVDDINVLELHTNSVVRNGQTKDAAVAVVFDNKGNWLQSEQGAADSTLLLTEGTYQIAVGSVGGNGTYTLEAKLVPVPTENQFEGPSNVIDGHAVKGQHLYYVIKGTVGQRIHAKISSVDGVGNILPDNNATYDLYNGRSQKITLTSQTETEYTLGSTGLFFFDVSAQRGNDKFQLQYFFNPQ